MYFSQTVSKISTTLANEPQNDNNNDHVLKKCYLNADKQAPVLYWLQSQCH